MTYLPVGTLITKIDDSPMASMSSDDPWDQYLLSPPSSFLQGWCTDESLLNKASGEWANILCSSLVHCLQSPGMHQHRFTLLFRIQSG